MAGARRGGAGQPWPAKPGRAWQSVAKPGRPWLTPRGAPPRPTRLVPAGRVQLAALRATKSDLLWGSSNSRPYDTSYVGLRKGCTLLHGGIELPAVVRVGLRCVSEGAPRRPRGGPSPSTRGFVHTPRDRAVCLVALPSSGFLAIFCPCRVSGFRLHGRFRSTRPPRRNKIVNQFADFCQACL